MQNVTREELEAMSGEELMEFTEVNICEVKRCNVCPLNEFRCTDDVYSEHEKDDVINAVLKFLEEE